MLETVPSMMFFIDFPFILKVRTAFGHTKLSTQKARAKPEPTLGAELILLLRKRWDTWGRNQYMATAEWAVSLPPRT